MASSRSTTPFLLLLVAALSSPGGGCYTSIVSFGDSHADTGNRLVIQRDRIARPPYGETFFHNPTGRFCDGRLILDFIAEAMGLPLVRPYLAGGGGSEGEGFRYGVNFAVGGATALEGDYFRAKGMEVMWTEYSLMTQLRWFKQLRPSLCSTASECEDAVGNSLFLVGEIGGNDYNSIFYRGSDDLDVVRSFVPDVVSAISSTVQELIEMGARTLVVPGNLPIGCVAVYLRLFQSEREEDYDPETGCLKWMNDFAAYHNRRLLQELDRLRQQHPEATIVYADYFEAAMSIYRSPQQYGFGASALAACCGGGGGAYNANSSCGVEEGWTVCDDPSSHISWDGIHMTEAAHKLMARGLLASHTHPSLLRSCPHIDWSVLMMSSADGRCNEKPFHPPFNLRLNSVDQSDQSTCM